MRWDRHIYSIHSRGGSNYLYMNENCSLLLYCLVCRHALALARKFSRRLDATTFFRTPFIRLQLCSLCGGRDVVSMQSSSCIFRRFRYTAFRSFFPSQSFTRSVCLCVCVRVSACLEIIFVSVTPHSHRVRSVETQTYEKYIWKGCYSYHIHNFRYVCIDVDVE